VLIIIYYLTYKARGDAECACKMSCGGNCVFFIIERKKEMKLEDQQSIEAPGFMAGSLLSTPEKTSSLLMRLVDPRRVPALWAHDRLSLHHPPPSNWSSQRRAPAPEPRWRWYAGGLPSRHTAN
jgi:hypothetical protein